MTDEPLDDPIERELQRRFADVRPGTDDTDAVLTSMQPRLRRARRSRRAVSASVAALGVVLLVVVGFTALSSTESTRRVNVPPATRSPSVPTTVTTPDGAGAPDGPDTNDAADDGGTVPPSPTTTPAGEIPTATTDPGGAENPTPAATPPTGDAPYSSPGGSIVVHRAGDTISLASSTPVAGFAREVHDDGPTRVEVRFKGDETEWRIRVDLVNGELVAETTQHG